VNPWLLMGVVWAIAAVLFTLLWWWCERRRDASWVDVAWASGVGTAAVVYACLTDALLERRVLVAAMATVWALRLATHLSRRLVRSGREDKRYARMRELSGDRAGLVFFAFFQMQAFWVVLLSSPMLAAISASSTSLGWLDLAGVTVWLIALAGEAWADRSLSRFAASDASRGVCRDGLWGWSRHPNYFFEWLFWWSFVCIGVSGGPLGPLTLIGPTAILVLLFTVTGIVPAELSSLRSRGEAFAEYRRRVSVWIPLPPRSQPTNT